MESEFDFKKYVDWNVYAVTSIRGKYGFRIVLKFSDGTTSIQQKSGYRTSSLKPYWSRERYMRRTADGEKKSSGIWIIFPVPLMVIREVKVFIIPIIRSYWQSRGCRTSGFTTYEARMPPF